MPHGPSTAGHVGAVTGLVVESRRASAATSPAADNISRPDRQVASPPGAGVGCWPRSGRDRPRAGPGVVRPRRARRADDSSLGEINVRLGPADAGPLLTGAAARRRRTGCRPHAGWAGVSQLRAHGMAWRELVGLGLGMPCCHLANAAGSGRPAAHLRALRGRPGGPRPARRRRPGGAVAHEPRGTQLPERTVVAECVRAGALRLRLRHAGETHRRGHKRFRAENVYGDGLAGGRASIRPVTVPVEADSAPGMIDTNPARGIQRRWAGAAPRRAGPVRDAPGASAAARPDQELGGPSPRLNRENATTSSQASCAPPRPSVYSPPPFAPRTAGRPARGRCRPGGRPDLSIGGADTRMMFARRGPHSGFDISP